MNKNFQVKRKGNFLPVTRYIYIYIYIRVSAHILSKYHGKPMNFSADTLIYTYIHSVVYQLNSHDHD